MLKLQIVGAIVDRVSSLLHYAIIWVSNKNCLWNQHQSWPRLVADPSPATLGSSETWAIKTKYGFNQFSLPN